MSEACNIGHAPVIDAEDEALTRARLGPRRSVLPAGGHIAAVNAKLIEAQAEVPIVKFWGEGLLASVDGLRFVVPKRTMMPGRRRSTASGGVARQCAENGREAKRVAAGDVVTNGNLVNPPA
ncbi:Tn3 family transposase [Streptomyces sp. NPDC002588]|uniref:Tn3 family transposase n=1 Tax=Streptomyces sp. NPDC002588 TaxID=3154419 RepID=UPI00331A8A88